jgi:hypothetical protein
MWLDDLASTDSWMSVWRSRIICGNCEALITTMLCPICGHDHTPGPPKKVVHKGQMIDIPQNAFMGAIEWSTYMSLELMRREWNRPIVEQKENTWGYEVPQKMLIVILFWTLFETLMDKFFSSALKNFPTAISEDLLKRYSFIGARIGKLYKTVFSTSLKTDLEELGYGHIFNHISDLQKKRNDFIHGNPNAVDQNTIDNTIKYLQETQLAWIELYNKRCTKFARPTAVRP